MSVKAIVNQYEINGSLNRLVLNRQTFLPINLVFCAVYIFQIKTYKCTKRLISLKVYQKIDVCCDKVKHMFGIANKD